MSGGLIDTNVDLFDRFDCAPGSDEAGFHDKNVACTIHSGFAALLADFNDTFENVAEFVSGPLPGNTKSRLGSEYSGLDIAAVEVLLPCGEKWIAFDHSFRRQPAVSSFAKIPMS